MAAARFLISGCRARGRTMRERRRGVCECRSWCETWSASNAASSRRSPPSASQPSTKPRAARGLMAPYMRPIYTGAHIAGTAVTVSVPPGRQLDDSRRGGAMPGRRHPRGRADLRLRLRLFRRSARDLARRRAACAASSSRPACATCATLTEMRFPVWSRYVSAQGTVKETLGSVNVPLVCAGALVNPGDVIVADDDGVCVVAARSAAAGARQSRARASRRKRRCARGSRAASSASTSTSMRERAGGEGTHLSRRRRTEPRC